MSLSLLERPGAESPFPIESTVQRLSAEFGDRLPVDRIRAVVTDSFANIAGSGVSVWALPELVERSARERLRELAG